MSKSSLEAPLIERTRKVTQLLIISGALNILLLCTFVYLVLKDREISVPIELRPSSKERSTSAVTNEQLLRSYSMLSFQDLLLRLDNKELVEDGYNKRDLSLACLVAFHHFNLERALGGLELQKRLIPFRNAQGGEQIPLVIYPGLADFQYQAILHYARTEKWPFTPQGLFFEIQRTTFPRDPTLLEAFYLTPHFHTTFLLFTRTGLKMEKEMLVEMVSQGDWNILSAFTDQQRLAQDLSIERRRTLLLEYLNQRSIIAAKLFLEVDLEFACKRMSDAQVLTLFDLLPANYPPLARFSRELITSPRSDAVWKKAAGLLYLATAEAVPEPYDHLATIRKFAPHFLPTPAEPVLTAAIEEPVQASAQALPAAVVKTKATSAPKQAASKKRTHTVANGDNLWKIARKYRVSVDAIKRANHLETEKLRVGRVLEIPER
ncbi:MAG: LysM peptidoglycan-binding domain-containing protein [Chlamydiales bacterium]|nr:LysM peptidoglycan-binding domain-containing protein [Chlamydiales bacterium]